MDSNMKMEVAALGRPFSLGMLYDCRSDSLVPGLTLWDHNDLQNHITERPQKYSDFEIVASESIEDKASALDVNASLRASFLGGLVEVNGSARYLTNNKTSKNQARVTLKYKATTKVQELSMNHLGRGNMKHPYVFEKGLATHVVTAILYGAQAFFVFDREVSQNENQQNIEGNLKLAIKKIPLLAIEGEGSLKMEENDKANVEKFSCSFIGDLSLQKMPTSFEDAIQVYQSLPSLLGANGENAVPMKAWLLPLTTLDSSAAKLVRQISVSLVQESQSVLEDFTELEMRCNDALRTTTAQQFPQVEKKIKTFKVMCSEFKLGFQQALAKKLPSIRGGGEEEAGLAEILKKIHSSPFNSENLTEWMKCKNREIMLLKRFTNMMKNTTVVSAQNFDEVICSSDYCVCFVFTSLGVDEPFLSVLSNYLRQKPESENPGDPRTCDVEKEQWYSAKEVSDSMRKKAKLFGDFAEANKENENVKFLMVGMTDQTQKGSTIYFCKDGFTDTEDFEPPSKPEPFTVCDVNHNSVTLKFDPPKSGSEIITSYSVEYCISGEEGWKPQTVEKPGQITVADLSPNTEYMFRCRAVTDVGVGPANQIKSPIKTLPCSPPGKPQVQSNSTEMSDVKPAEIGRDVHNSGDIVEYAKPDKEEDLQCSQKQTGAEEMIISELQPKTEYDVRVRGDRAAAGRTTKNKPVSEQLKQQSKRITNASPSVYKLTLNYQTMSIKGCRRFNLGNKRRRKKNCTIMVMGATGSGKSTLINGMINYIVGVNWKDDFRFKIIEEDESRSQSESQTSEVTVYKVHHQEGFRIKHSLTIVDTPGFGDTRGIERDREITEMLRNLFSQSFGVSEIHAVCFVAQSSLARLTATQKYVFDSVLSIFGKDIAENLRVLVTFADGQVPPVLKAINDSGVPCPKTEDGQPVHFKFNNSALFADNTSSADSMNFDEMFWDMGAGSMERFFDALDLIDPKSLTMTKEVLRERKQLENSVEKLQEQVKISLAKLEEIKETEAKLKEFEAEIRRNENFEIEVTVTKAFKVEHTHKGRFLTNCQQCHFTCHERCVYADDKDKIKCCAMGSDGRCTVCPGKCSWNLHFNQKYKWEYVEVKEKQTIADLKKKYDVAKKDKSPIEALFGKLKHGYDAVKTTVKDLIKNSAQCLNRLKEIALKPDPLSAPEYIDMLIEGEKSEAKPGWKQRVQSLTEMREQAEIMAKINKGEAPHSSLV
ncbi:uncharacterized protein LOC121519669 [Cheilinus undulatus]|uniref:uncharacterized protein LOC121519669 n=1 Tax=Cheilinus undulatus TaxID=241271 RepID=UPI001BD53B32|nr:uncharacterized protein LOC121519669 [Cheilinus undulatus]